MFHKTDGGYRWCSRAMFDRRGLSITGQCSTDRGLSIGGKVILTRGQVEADAPTTGGGGAATAGKPVTPEVQEGAATAGRPVTPETPRVPCSGGIVKERHSGKPVTPEVQGAAHGALGRAEEAWSDTLGRAEEAAHASAAAKVIDVTRRQTFYTIFDTRKESMPLCFASKVTSPCPSAWPVTYNQSMPLCFAGNVRRSQILTLGCILAECFLSTPASR